MTTHSSALKLATLTLCWLSLGVLVVLSVRGLLDPLAGSAAFGLSVQDAAGAFYHSVYRDRNLVIAILGVIYLVATMWRSFAILVTVSVSLPVYDIVALRLAQVPVAAVHYVTLAALVLLTLLAWVQVRLGEGAFPPSTRRD